MYDAEMHSDEDIDEGEDDEEIGVTRPERHDDEDDDEDDDDDGGEDGDEGDPMGGASAAAVADAAATLFGADFRGIGSYMVTLANRFKTILNNIKPKASPATRLVALQDLTEILSISTEDTLSGYFQVDAFVKELVRIMGGTGGSGDGDGDDGEGDEGEHDPDADLAAALAMSSGAGFGDENVEAQVLACRCLANLMEALPGCAHTVVYHGAVPVLCSKLVEISYIDLAEQTLSTLEKISEEYPSAVVREGGLSALLNYLDFFSTSIQRTALQAAANCCRNVSPDSFTMIRDVFPIIRNVLGYSDQRLVEYACLCVIRIIESFYRSSTDSLETLLDAESVRAINVLLLPAGGSSLVSPSTYSLCLRALSTAAKASPKITIAFLEADIVTTLYHILTGVVPPAEDSPDDAVLGSIAAAVESGTGVGGDDQGLGGSLADMAVMQNLAHRPKDQVEEALSFLSELMPPLPKDGIFDHRAYTEKSLARLAKAKAKAERAALRAAAAGTHVVSERTSREGLSESAAAAQGSPSASQRSGSGSGSMTTAVNPTGGESASAASTSASRSELLRSKPEVVGRFMRLMLPVLIEVYAATVTLSLRSKTMTALLKAASFLEAAELQRDLRYVPVAGFVSSILSSRDHPTLVIGALQLVELLLFKLPAEYRPSFLREGVLHEIESLAEKELVPKPKPESGSGTPAGGSGGEGSLPPPAVISGLRRLSSLAIDPQDAIILRARVLRFKYIADITEGPGDVALQSLKSLVERLSEPRATEMGLKHTLREIASLFSSPRLSISSFELIQSGLVEGLLEFATSEGRMVDVQVRQRLFLETFTTASADGADTPTAHSPFSILVKKLQESFTRMESYDVVTVAPGGDDSKRSPASMLARQLRLRLVAEGSDIPRSCSNVTVSIHAIATFQALNDYLRPRIAGISKSTSRSRISSVLAAFAAAGGLPPGAFDRAPSGLGTPAGTSGSAPAAAASSSTADASASSAGPSTSEGNRDSQGRRRSLRLSSKGGASTPTASTPAPAPRTAESLLADALMADADDSHDGFDDDDIEDEVFEDDLDASPSQGEKTVSLAVHDNGRKVEAQTPDGTRVATPNPAAKDTPTPGPSKSSYASAVKASPTDWHLEFSMDDRVLPLDMTIYGAIHQHEARRQPPVHPSNLWSGQYSVKYKKVPGPPPTVPAANETEAMDRSSSPIPSTASDNAPHSKILRLLKVLHKLNAQGFERFGTAFDTLPESAFVNNKLTAKLTRQLEEPMIVASSCLPDWALDLPKHFPFLFPFATRFSFLQSTSFGYARLILKWQSQQTRTSDSSRRDDTFGYLGRLQRQKVRISRKYLLESALKVLELYGSSSSVLEVEYFEEVGTGLGPTLEFYSLVSREFARRDIKMWHDADATSPGPYVSHPTGLFPAPFGRAEIAKETPPKTKRSDIFRILGQFVAKALLDSRIIDMSFNKIFLKIVMGEDVPLTITSLKLVDPALAASLAELQIYVDKMKAILSDPSMSQKSKDLEIESLTIRGAQLEDLALDFTVPGYDIELRPGGRDLAVNPSNLEEFIREVIDTLIGNGVRLQAQAFREGFSKVFPITDLQSFSSDELLMIFGNGDEDWSIETLGEAIKADHGFNNDSRPIRDLVQVMAKFDVTSRRRFLQFITGSPKLPIGGFRGLNPPLTVVRKPHEAPLTADDYLPSVMTCVNYLKLPEYSTREVMEERLRVAATEGVGSFHLS
ncbi:hypothetical protein BOTBODRAFT_113824 [Botryobasidium botryosum FD-172 SS1]|uniref:HECT-type E3 ubiquitin transferase n=1 Tax=Botryobasidium botryosum (strain FD-172 SS1) TaxID=930990 RepID=A0A067MJ76_BOTB1|nr:hypothetical protein BOTBODRAFT_113824 [Botryobasidium botryosum FD-172 SS1]